MNIIIQINSSEKNKVDKDLTTISTLTGTLREGTSIIDPDILVSASVDTLSNANYMTISAFGRSYFITDISSFREGLTRIRGHVDVLSSFKTQIRSNSAIISRQKTKYNLYLNDGSFKTYQNPMVITKSFSGGFNTQSFILAVAGG